MPEEITPQFPFKIQLSDFSFITRGMKNGKSLRLTLTCSFFHPECGLLGFSVQGCMVYRTRTGFRFSPPISRFGPRQSVQLMAITTDLHDMVIKLLKECKTKRGTTYLDYVGSEMPDFLRPKDPSEIDASLPREIGSGEEQEEEETNNDVLYEQTER